MKVEASSCRRLHAVIHGDSDRLGWLQRKQGGGQKRELRQNNIINCECEQEPLGGVHDAVGQRMLRQCGLLSQTGMKA